MQRHYYHFDTWSEYLTVTLGENIRQCQPNQPIKKIRIALSKENHWPDKFKVILDSELIATSPEQPVDSSGYQSIDYLYRNPSSIPFGKNVTDPTAKDFIQQAQEMNPDFFADAWDLKNPYSMPALLLQLAFRKVIHTLPLQLQTLNIQTSNDLEIQFFDGINFLSFSYDAIRHSIQEQKELYFTHKEIQSLAVATCFKHAHNIKWLSAIE